MTMNTAPTKRTYSSLDAAYDHFNKTLFSGQLPPCLITMQRHKGAYGYFSGNRFANRDNLDEITDEIALNPAHFAERTSAKILSTLAHEMVHLWQHHFGQRKSRSGYHNKEWAAMMRQIGLTPTDTGEEGGKDTGQKVTHMIEEGGRFDKACTAYLSTKPAILYHDRAGDSALRRAKTASKTKYSCLTCGQNAWAKPEANLICGDCNEPMEAEAAGQGD
jgi:predicted SprT family Zn-dependent metalloprotease